MDLILDQLMQKTKDFTPLEPSFIHRNKHRPGLTDTVELSTVELSTGVTLMEIDFISLSDWKLLKQGKNVTQQHTGIFSIRASPFWFQWKSNKICTENCLRLCIPVLAIVVQVDDCRLYSRTIDSHGFHPNCGFQAGTGGQTIAGPGARGGRIVNYSRWNRRECYYSIAGAEEGEEG